MYCKNCGAQLENATQYCPQCGAGTAAEAPVCAPVQPEVVSVIPPENRPLSPWAYFGLQLLFAVPVVGFIFLIIFSCNGSNINRRNFARSYWCSLIIALIVCAVIAVLAVAGIVSAEAFA